MKKTAIPFALTALAAATLASVATAAATITVDSVVQRWPWNNKLDITYTVTDGQDVSASQFKRIVFTAVIAGTTYTIDGVTDVGASANSGTHTVTWTAPAGVLSTTCTMTAAIYSATAPSGDDYLVVDLSTGAIAYEGMLATQADSNARYNSGETYKTTKMVLRKVPGGGTYPTGDSANYASVNSARTWTTDRDYYIGVFPVTQYQYSIIGADAGDAPSTRTWWAGNVNLARLRPVENVSWDDLRLATTASTSAIPAVATGGTGTFLQRLNFKTGLYFDLPTEVMFEIAQRAGTTTAYYWGDTWDANKTVNADNSGNCTYQVGSKDPNGWGLYDTAGNVWELCRDDYTSSVNMASFEDPFTPYYVENSTTRIVRGGNGYGSSNGPSFRSSNISSAATTTRANNFGFRVTMIAD